MTRVKAEAPPCAIIGTPPTLEWIAIDRLQVDTKYQRGTETPGSRRIIYGMVKRWDWRLCSPLNVSRRADGLLFVVDGQHRLVGARERGDIPHLPCVVTMHEDTADEAHTFVALNLSRQKLSQGDVFNASLASGDPDAHRVQELLTKAGLSHARHSNPTNWKPGQLFCGPAIQAELRRSGDIVVSNALVALAEAYSGKVLTHAGTLLKALYAIYAEDAKRPGFDPDLFIDALGAVEQDDWYDYSRDQRRANPSLSTRDAYALAFIEQYDALKAERRS